MIKKFQSLLILIICIIPFFKIDANKADSLNELARQYLVRKLHKSEIFAKQAIHYSRIEQNNNELVKAYITLSEFHMENKRYDVAIDSLYMVVPHINDIPLETANNLLKKIGEAHYGMRNDSVTFRKNIFDMNNIENLRKNSKLLLHLIDFYIANNNLKKAAESIQRATVITAKLDDSQMQNRVLFKRGIVQYRLNYYDRAQFSFEETLEYYQLANNLQLQSECLQYLGDIHYAKLNYRKADSLFKCSLKLDNPITQKIKLLKSLAQISIINEEYKNAINYLKDAIDNLDESQSFYSTEIYYLLSGAYFISKENEKARLYYDTTIHFAKQNRNFSLLGKALYGKSKCYSQEDELEAANFYLKNAYSALEKNFELRMDEQYAKENAVYNDIYQSSQIDELRKDQYIKELELKNSNTQNKFLLTFLIGAILISLVLIYLYFQHRKFNRELKEKNQIIFQNNDELKSVNGALSSSQLKLLTSNKVKDKMFSIITHDIKGAIISIRTLLEAVQTESKISSPNNISSSINSIDNTVSLINNHISWAISQSGSLNIDRGEVQLCRSIQKAIKLHEGMILSQNLKVNISCDSELKIITDKKMFQLIFNNILSNALKYSPNDSIISVAIQNSGKQLIASVADNGQGISSEKMGKLFQQPVQNENVKANSGGSGLYLSQKFAKALDGKIWVENNKPNGCIFYISLPS